jgi:hypothetical protein
VKRSTLEERKRFAEQLAARDAPAKIGRPRTRVVTDEQTAQERYRMRRWWLDRYSLDEIRELAECLQ